MKQLLPLVFVLLLGFSQAAYAQTPACPPPTAPIISNLTTNSATVNFTAAAGATNYTITVTRSGAVVQTQTTRSSPMNLMGLFPSNAYTVSIVTNCAAGGTSVPVTVTVTTASAPVNCPAIAGLTVTPTSATTATVSFLPTAGASGYAVAYSTSGTPLVQLAVTNSPATLTGLQPGTAYSVRVTSNCNGSTGTPVSANFTTPAASAMRATLAGGELAVFPNPAHHACTVRIPAVVTAYTAHLELANTLGQTIRAQIISLTASGTEAAVDVTGLVPGLYSLRVYAGAETVTVRLVVD